MYGVEPAWSEQLTVSRDGVFAGDLIGGYDPAERKLYLWAGADVRQGDVVTVRGITSRVIELPELWRDAGLVVTLEDAREILSDVAVLYRRTPGGFDRVTRTYAEPGLVELWTGPCSVKAESAVGTEAEVTEQQVTVQPFSITVPLELTNVLVDDVFKVIDSRDMWLIGRELVVTRIEGGTEGQARIIRLVDNQG